MGAAVSCVASNGGRQLLTAAGAGDSGIVREVIFETERQLITSCQDERCTPTNCHHTHDASSGPAPDRPEDYVSKILVFVGQ